METSEATDRFYQAIWPHREMVLRAAMIQTGNNTAEAEDLAQETFLKAFRAMETFRQDVGVKSWLLTILRNTRIDRLRTASGAARHLSLEELVAEPAVSGSMTEDSDVAWEHPEELLNGFSDAEVIGAMTNLAEELRWTLLLVDVEGMDQSEAAKILDVPVGTIKSRAHRGRAMLREALLPLARQRRLVRE